MRPTEEYRSKLVSPQEAVKEVRSHDVVVLGHSLQVPDSLCQALGQRKDELQDITIQGSFGVLPMPWHQAGYEKTFSPVTRFISGFERPLVEKGQLAVETMDIALMTKSFLERRKQNRHVFFARVSEPDEEGNCSFGEMVWSAKAQSEGADVILAEVHPGLIRTGGDNHIHVSEISKFVKADPSFGRKGQDVLKMGGMTLSDNEEIRVAEVIGATIATDLIKDGDIVQIGAGAVSGAMCAYLHGKKDLGVHSEIIPGGMVELVKEGAVTGKTNKVHPGKLVASAFMGLTVEELAYVDNNPKFELYDTRHINDPRVISQNDNMVGINNALAVDLSGQVASESLGPQVYTGAGGQIDFVVGAMLSRGGRSITCLPSTAKKGTVSRITPTLALGQGVVVPRYWVDYIVTEYGVASLFGKTLKERAQELIAVAHPDFRGQLREAAKELGRL